MYVLIVFAPYAALLNAYVPEFAANASSVVDQIDKHTLEIAQADDETYTNMQELGDELPDHSPRYVLLSYPLTLVGFYSIFGPAWSG